MLEDHKPGAAAAIGAAEKVITYSSKARAQRENFMSRASFGTFDVLRNAKESLF